MAKSRKQKPYKTNKSNQTKRRKIIEETQLIVKKLTEKLK